MMSINNKKIKKIRNEFQKSEENALTKEQFVMIFKNIIHEEDDNHGNMNTSKLARWNKCKDESDPSDNDLDLVVNLGELFAHIDVNGDGTMEWDEFTSYIVDQGNLDQENDANPIQKYYHVECEDNSKHSSLIEHLYYFDKVDKVAVVEGNQMKLLDNNLGAQKTIAYGDGLVLCADHMADRSQYVLSTSDLRLSCYDDQSLRIVKSLNASSAQTCMRWANTDNMLFTSGVNGIVHAWNMDDMTERHRMGGPGRDGRLLRESHEDMVLDLMHIPTLESIVSASMDRTIKLWDVNSGALRKTLEGHTKGVRSLAYNSEFRFFVSAGFDYDALVWNPYVEHMILRLHGHSAPLCNVEMIPSTPQIVTADTAGVFKVWDIRNFSCVQTFNADNAEGLRDFVSVTPHKKLVAASRRLHVFKCDRLLNPELTDDFPLVDAVFNKNFGNFATISNKNIKIWNASDGRVAKTFPGRDPPIEITSLVLDDRERKMIVGNHGGEIKVLDYTSGAIMKQTEADHNDATGKKTADTEKKEVTQIVYVSEYKIFISIGWDGAISIYDEMYPDEIPLIRRISNAHLGEELTSVAFSYPLSLIASGSHSCLIVWDFEFARFEALLSNSGGGSSDTADGVLAICFLEKHFPAVISSDTNENIHVWAVRPAPAIVRNKLVVQFKNLYQASVVSLVVVDKILYAGDDGGHVSEWDLSDMVHALEDQYGCKDRVGVHRCENPRRFMRVDAHDLVLQSIQAKSQQQVQEPICSQCHVKCVRSWRAHDDSIQSLQIMEDPPAVLTSSRDCLAKVFSLRGEPLGTFRQGENLCGSDWIFRLDVDARTREKLRQARMILETINDQQRNMLLLSNNNNSEQDESDDEEQQSVGMNSSEEQVMFGISNNKDKFVRRTPRRPPVRPHNAGRPRILARQLKRSTRRKQPKLR